MSRKKTGGSSSEFIVRVDSVSKTFKLPHEKHSSLKGLFVSMFKGSRKYEVQQVLSKVSFDIRKGEFIGIVGRNGSGKSTLLKLLAGIYVPDSGNINVNGTLTPFIELGVGFNPELTGHENVFLNGALLGFSRKEMEKMYDEIVDFAELENFMDLKLKNYSSGMQVRLAFSIAIRARSEILLLDEVLAVGDANFQRKCFEYFRVLKKEKKTVILVTHSMSNVTDLCDRALVIDRGELIYQGSPSEAANKYEMLNMRSQETPKEKVKLDAMEEVAKIRNVKLSKKQEAFSQDDDIELLFDLHISQDSKVIIAMAVHKDDGSYATYYNTEEQLGLIKCRRSKSPYKVKLLIESGQFGKGSYRIDLAVYSDKKPREYLSRKASAALFSVSESSGSRGGVFNVSAKWGIGPN